jgi:MinD-like ATPase involved in chromosome partitioning or flagellar assembly
MGGIVLNKMTYKNYELEPRDIKNLLGAEIAQEIPFDYAVPESIAKGQPVVLYKKHSPAGIAYKKLAGALVGEEYYSGAFDRLKTFLMNKISR